ncbi:MAG TPA: SGNH/GDSL hydrolase family protein [Candidatus Sulfotelmatobacter sp.]|nr:SGNH/GDSL hydrolase family protein [Candidatus Sulfotelmatobacter sp.]
MTRKSEDWKQDLKQLPQEMIIVLIILMIVGICWVFLRAKTNTTTKSNNIVDQKTYTQTRKNDAPFGLYTSPKIPKKDVYSIVMVGDSMTEALGPHGGKLNEFINTLYQSTPGHQRIVIDNYAKGSTNILGLEEAMMKKTVSGDSVFPPLLSRPFDLILIESFGYNPLSQLGIDGGLKKQTQVLDSLMKLLTRTHPNSAIFFVATIAPNGETYGQNEAPGETLGERQMQAKERMDYIKNHIAYAKSHNIPLIDIYDKSLTPSGDGDLSYINPNDHIHPSFQGIDFISQEIANFIYANQTLQK